jgi:hypothetical protein
VLAPAVGELLDVLRDGEAGVCATVAYLYGASAATAYNPDADLDAIERIVRRGGWQAPDLLVYELIQRYRTEN